MQEKVVLFKEERKDTFDFKDNNYSVKINFSQITKTKVDYSQMAEILKICTLWGLSR